MRTRLAQRTKVANLEVAILVDEEIAWFEVAVEHLGRVDRLEPAQDLVNEILDVVVRERLQHHAKRRVR